MSDEPQAAAIAANLAGITEPARAPRAELVFTIGRSHREEDGTLVIDEITEMHWSAWC